MVVTRSQTRLIPSPSAGDKNSHNVSADEISSATVITSVTPPREERLGRGCRIPRPAAPTYDSIYLQNALKQKQPKHIRVPDFQINTRYPERDAAKRAMARMSDTLDVLNGKKRGLSVSSDDTDSRRRGGDVRADRGFAETPALSRIRSHGASCKAGPRKRAREDSIDSSITDESLRQGSPPMEGDEGLLVDHSSLDLTSEETMDGSDVERARRNAKKCASKNISINHYLNTEIKGASSENKRDPVGSSNRHGRRRREEIFLGLGGTEGVVDHHEQGGSNVENRNAPGSITPLSLDKSVTFEKVGGLSAHIMQLREMVLFPLMYPGVLQAMNLTPPRGVLFVGPPGTGKTLLARALANESMLHANQKITFFMRKGADILSKWVGEAERQLILLFEEAKRQQPSIIFFDELDGLVPVRHFKSEQSHAALVATLLALIDGLEDRGQVVVIGATNRPDAIDPALRRPGRFDRELYFPLPDMAARRHILDIVTKPMLPADRPDREEILQELTVRCAGWTGAEIEALCTEAGLNRLRTALPQIYTTSRKLKVPENALVVEKEDFFIAAHRVKTSMRRVVGTVANSLDEHLEHLLHTTQRKLLSCVTEAWPSALAVLTRERRDCSNASDAVLELSSFPISHIAHPLILFLSAESCGSETDREDSEFAARKAASTLTKALPSIRTFTLYLPHLVVDRSASGLMGVRSSDDLPQPCDNMTGGIEGNVQGSGDNFDAGHIHSCISAVQRCSGPSLVILQGLDEWLEDHGFPCGASYEHSDERDAECVQDMLALCYYINCLRDKDTLIVIPTARRDASSALFGGNRLSKQLRTAVCNVPCAPLEDDLRRFLSYVYLVVDVALRTVASATLEELPVDLSPPPPPSPKQVHAAWVDAMDLWRRVDFRRRQLRYVLTKWLGQYINNKRFSLFISSDLDLTPAHDLYSEWRRHTRGRRIGLSDVMTKLENEEYTCLSQYNDDIDVLVQNVRSFFRTISAFDQRYRSRALELKEQTVLNLYKINRTIVFFCEQHKDLVMPAASPYRSDEEGESQGERAKVGQVRPADSALMRKKKGKGPKYYRMGRRRRRYVRRSSSSRAKVETTEHMEVQQPLGLKNEVVEVVHDNVARSEERLGREKENEERMEMGYPTVEVKRRDEEGAVEGVPVDQPVATEPVSVPLGAEPHTAAACENAATTQHDCRGDWMDAVLPKLKGLSFLQLHLVMQSAMRLLEAEVDGRRQQQKSRMGVEGGAITPEGDLKPAASPASLCVWMLSVAINQVRSLASHDEGSE